MSLLEVKNVSFAFKDKKVLHDISFTLDQGEKVIIIGPNGCGKTTLLRVISGYLSPDNGEVLLEGQNLHKMNVKDRAKMLSMMHQENTSNFDFKVREIVEMGRYPYLSWNAKLSKKDKDAVENAMKIMNVKELEDKSIMGISGGEKARVMAAKAYSQESKLMLMDEPISSMDIKQEFHLMNVVKNDDSSYIIILHDLNLASIFATKIILMKDGRIVSMGSAKEVLTIENIMNVYGVDSEIITRNDKPFVIPINKEY